MAPTPPYAGCFREPYAGCLRQRARPNGYDTTRCLRRALTPSIHGLHTPAGPLQRPGPYALLTPGAYANHTRAAFAKRPSPTATTLRAAYAGHLRQPYTGCFRHKDRPNGYDLTPTCLRKAPCTDQRQYTEARWVARPSVRILKLTRSCLRRAPYAEFTRNCLRRPAASTMCGAEARWVARPAIHQLEAYAGLLTRICSR